MTLRLRGARADDQAALLPLWRELDRLHAGVAPGFFRGGDAGPDRCPPELTREALVALPRAADATLLVAEAEEAVVGALHASLRDTPALPSMSPCRRLFVETLVVDPAWRRRGVGRALMAEAATWGKRRGAEQAVLTVWAGNGEAEGFYRSLGYSPVSQVLARDLA